VALVSHFKGLEVNEFRAIALLRLSSKLGERSLNFLIETLPDPVDSCSGFHGIIRKDAYIPKRAFGEAGGADPLLGVV